MRINKIILFLIVLSLTGIPGATGNAKIKNPVKSVKDLVDKKNQKDSKEKPKETPKETPKEIKYDYVMTDKSDIEADVIKLLPAKSVITHRITEGIFGPADGTKGMIKIVPYITGNNGKVQLMLLIPAEIRKYNKMMLGEISFGGNSASEVLSVFFDQADKDKERELFVLCAYVKGNRPFFETAVYDWNKTRFDRVPGLESKIKNLTPAINVRRALRAMESQSGTGKAKK